MRILRWLAQFLVALAQALRRRGASQALRAAEVQKQVELEKQKLEDEVRLRQARTAAIDKNLQDAVEKQKAAQERLEQWKRDHGFL